MRTSVRRRSVLSVLCLLLCLFVSAASAQQGSAPPSNSQQSSAQQSGPPAFKKEQLDQMLAPVALYPDSLLSQILMASTYPSDVADAATWSKAHPKSQGDAAVKEVASQPWDPSVQSLVAFPQVLAQMQQQPDWVQNVGDAFLAQPEDVMASVQRLRAQAQKAGNLKSTEQQKVIVQQATPETTVIQIEPTNPEVVYVPSYNPTVVYGSWAYPSYPPPYWPPPPGYAYPVMSGLAAGLAFGTGIAVANCLWGGFNWGHGDVDINVNRYNNINTNNRISGNGNQKWNHNPENRRGTPYRDNASRQKFSPGVGGADQRQNFRGRDTSRESQRQNALSSFNRSTNNGAASNLRQHEGPGGGNRGAGAGNRQAGNGSRAGAGGGGIERNGAGSRDVGNRNTASHNAGNRSAGNRGASANAGARSNSNAFSGARAPDASRAQTQRGRSSQQSFHSQRPASSGRQVSRPSPARSGGGGRGGRR